MIGTIEEDVVDRMTGLAIGREIGKETGGVVDPVLDRDRAEEDQDPESETVIKKRRRKERKNEKRTAKEGSEDCLPLKRIILAVSLFLFMVTYYNFIKIQHGWLALNYFFVFEHWVNY